MKTGEEIPINACLPTSLARDATKAWIIQDLDIIGYKDRWGNSWAYDSRANSRTMLEKAPGDLAWEANDDLSNALLVEGQKWEQVIGGMLRGLGYRVVVQESKIQAGVGQRGQHSHLRDLCIDGRFYLECRSRNLYWVSSATLPFKMMMVGDAHAWDLKPYKIVGLIYVSQVTSCALYLNYERSRPAWDEIVQDNPRSGKKNARSYVCPRELFEPLDAIKRDIPLNGVQG